MIRLNSSKTNTYWTTTVRTYSASFFQTVPWLVWALPWVPSQITSNEVADTTNVNKSAKVTQRFIDGQMYHLLKPSIQSLEYAPGPILDAAGNRAANLKGSCVTKFGDTICSKQNPVSTLSAASRSGPLCPEPMALCLVSQRTYNARVVTSQIAASLQHSLALGHGAVKALDCKKSWSCEHPH